MRRVVRFFKGWILRRRLSGRTPLSDRLVAVSSLESRDLLAVDAEAPFFVMQYELYASLRGDGTLMQNLLCSVILLINVRRAAFNGAASEGLAVASDGGERLEPVQPGDAVSFAVAVGDDPLLYGSASMHAHSVMVPD